MYSMCWTCVLVLALVEIISAELDIVLHPESQAVVPGQDLVMNCVGAYSQTLYEIHNEGRKVPDHLVYSWEFNGSPVENVIPQSSVFLNHSLYIPAISELQYGSYQCVVQAVFEGTNITVTSDVATVIETYLDEFYTHPTLSSTDPFTIGEIVTLNCISGRGAPRPHVYWRKDNITFTYGQQTVATFGSTGSGNSAQLSLQLLMNITAESAGVYSCVAENKMTGQSVYSKEVTVTVNGPEPKPYFITEPPSNLILMSNTPSLVSCHIGGSQPLTYTWYRNSRIIRGRSPRFKVLTNGTLYILNVIKEDAVPFRCSARNDYGSVLSGPINVTVTYLELEFQLQPADTVGIAGQSCQLHCISPLSLPPATVIWYKDNVPVQDRSGEFGVTVLSNWTLLFTRVQLTDQGQYVCVAVNDLTVPSSRTSNIAKLTVAAAPTITEPPIDTTLIKGDLLQLKCKVEGSPLPSVIWYHNDMLLKADSRVDIRLSGQELYVQSVNKGDEGQYYCVVNNTHGVKASAQVFVDIIVPPEIVAGIRTTTVLEGHNVQLSCQVYGDPQPEVTWYFEGVKLDLRFPLLHASDAGLEIHNITRHQAGTYSCVAHNAGGRKESNGVVHVQVPPEVSIAPLNHTVTGSTAVVMYCDMYGIPQPQIIWKFKETEPLPQGSLLSHNNRSLVIQTTTVRHSGAYTCIGQSTVGRIQNTAYVFVQVKPAITAILTNGVPTEGQFVLDQGDDLELDCEVTGIPTPRVDWYFTDMKLYSTSEGRISLNTPTSVKVLYVSAADTGLYTCRAGNEAGEASRAVKVIVREVPLAPYLTSAASTSKTSVNLHWNEPLSKLHQVITGYVVQFKVRTSLVFTQYNTTISPGMTSTEVGGLQPATQYVFRVAAVNHLGTGQYSNILGAKTLETAPSAPRNLRVTRHNSTSLGLQWEVPQVTSGDIKIYQLMYRKTYREQDFKEVELSPVTVPLQLYTLSPLHPYTTYSVQVRAATVQDNVIMWGDTTQQIQATTDAAAPAQAPGQLQLVVKSSRSILVSWDKIHPDNENGPLLGYVVTYTETTITNRSQEIQVKPESNTGVLLEGLLPWIHYQIQVLAYNGEGRGPMSGWQLARTWAEAPSGVPQKVSVSAVSATDIQVKWQSLSRAEMNSEISGYIVIVANDINDDIISKYVGSPQILQLTISNLLPWTKYYINVQAFTTQVQNGFGPFSNTRVVTTQQDVPRTVSEFQIQSFSSVLELSWSVPLQPNGEITGYTVIYEQLNAKGRNKRDLTTSTTRDLKSHFLNPFVHSFRIKDLDPITTYLVGVAAHTKVGQGPFVNKTVRTASVPQLSTTDQLTEVNGHSDTTLVIGIEQTRYLERMDTTQAVDPVTNSAHTGLSSEEVTGVVVGVILVVLLLIIVAVAIVWYCKKRRKQPDTFSSPDLTSRIGTYPGFNDTSNNDKPTSRTHSHTGSHTDSYTESQGESTRSFAKVDPRELMDRFKHPYNNNSIGVPPATSTPDTSIIQSTSDRPQSVPSSVTGPLNYQPSVAATAGATVADTHLGISNPGYSEDQDNTRDLNISMQSNRLSTSSIQSADVQPRRSRMDNTMAAVIAAERDRNTSVFDIHDTETLVDVDTSVIVYDERTAL